MVTSGEDVKLNMVTCRDAFARCGCCAAAAGRQGERASRSWLETNQYRASRWRRNRGREKNILRKENICGHRRCGGHQPRKSSAQPAARKRRAAGAKRIAGGHAAECFAGGGGSIAGWSGRAASASQRRAYINGLRRERAEGGRYYVSVKRKTKAWRARRKKIENATDKRAVGALSQLSKTAS